MRHPSPATVHPGDGETLDAICGGQIQILQRQQGYRFNLDPILLTHFAHASSRGLRGRVAELGTGSGIIPLLLARKFDHPDVTALEIQPSLYSLAQRNVRLNGCEGQIRLVEGDLRDAPALLGRGVFQHVLANPPYGGAARGILNPIRERAIARHEVLCSIFDVARVGSELLVDGGSLWLVYPAARLSDLYESLLEHALRPRRMQAVHPRLNGKARLVLLQAVKRGRNALTVCAPLVLHQGARGEFSGAVARMLGPLSSH